MQFLFLCFLGNNNNENNNALSILKTLIFRKFIHCQLSSELKLKAMRNHNDVQDNVYLGYLANNGPYTISRKSLKISKHQSHHWSSGNAYLFSRAPGHSGRPQSIRPKDWEGLQRAQQEDGCGAGAGGVRGEEIYFVTSCRGCSWVEILTFIAASWLTMSLFYVHGYVWSESKGMVIVAWFLKIPWPNKSRTIGLLRRMILRASCTYHTKPHGLVIGLGQFLAPRTLFLDLFLLVSMPLVKTRH